MDPESVDRSPEQVAVYASTLAQERLERLGEPYARSYERLHRLLFPPGHPYRRQPAGEPDSIARIGDDDVRRFHARYYHPSRLVLAVVGEILPERVFAAVERLWPTLPPQDNGERPRVACSMAPPAADRGPRRRTVRAPAPAPCVFLGCRGPGLGQPGWLAATLFFRGMTLGQSSPLRARLIHGTGLASRLTAVAAHQRDASTFVAAAIAAPGVEALRLEQEVWQAVGELAAAGISPEMLERVRAKARSDLLSQLQRRERRADFFARAASLGAVPLDDHLTQLAALDAESVTRAGAALLDRDAAALLTWVPEQPR